MENVDQKVTEIIVDKLGVDESQVTPNAHFINEIKEKNCDEFNLSDLLSI